MNYIYHILSIATTFGALSNMTFLGQKCIPILGMRPKLCKSQIRPIDPVMSIFPETEFLTPFYASMLTLTREPGCVGGRRRRWCPQCEERAAGHTRPGRAGGEGFLGHRGLVCSAGGQWEWG